MPRYFFDIHDGKVVQDSEGIEFPDIAAAQAHAMSVAADYARDPVMLSSGGGAIVVQVYDTARQIVRTVRLVFGVDVP